jgi:hypothetical protein
MFLCPEYSLAINENNFNPHERKSVILLVSAPLSIAATDGADPVSVTGAGNVTSHHKSPSNISSD